MKRLLIFIALYLLVGLQISISAPFGGLHWDFDLVLIFLIFVASSSSRSGSVLWAILAGLLLDVFDPVSFGGHMVAKSTVVFLFTIIDDSLNLSQPTLLGFVILVLALIDRVIFRLFTPFVQSFGMALVRWDLPSAVLTAILGFVLLWIALRAGLFLPGHIKDTDSEV
ncbi:MAG TPA: hypothetical protein ENN07_05830 [candidate division Zixibacteria bacterium]|nr:hypothetical protein [candidate division Zixibacteria bacterium]